MSPKAFNKITAFILLVFVCFSFGKIYAISEGGAIFLLIRPGARPSGMGSAFAAIADDATATYFNPAGLGFLMPQETSSFVEDDIKNWGQLMLSLQERDEYFLFKQDDLIDPAAIVISAKQSPLLLPADISDWKAFAGIFSDSLGYTKTSRLLADSLAQAALAESQPDGEIGIENKWVLLHALNRRMADQGLYRQSVIDGVILPEQAAKLAGSFKYSEGSPQFTTADFLRPESLAVKLKNAADPLSKYLFDRFSYRTRKSLGGDLNTDSLNIILAGELNKIISSGKIYRTARFKNAVLPNDLMEKAAQTLTGRELKVLNMELLEAAYPQEILISLKSDRMSPDDLLRLNRAIIEAYLPEVLNPYGKRLNDDSLAVYIKTKINEAGWELLKNYNGTDTLSSDEISATVDFFNTIINNYDFPQIENKNKTGSFKEKRMVLENEFPGQIYSYADKLKASPLIHIRNLLGSDYSKICDKYTSGKTIAREDKEAMLAGLNLLLSNRALYREEYFKGGYMDPVAQEYILEGIEDLSEKDLKILNRKLLESMLPEVVRRKVSPMPHYATMMHSPWLSQIWSDVGDMYYEFIAYAQPVKDWGVFGGNIIFLSEGTNEHIDDYNNVLGTFSSYEFSPTLTYANKIYDNLAGGINLKLIYSHLAPFGAPGQQGKGIATTWAIDLGALYKGPINGLALGLIVQNIGPNLTYIDAQEADPLSRNLRLGTAYDILDGKLSKLTVAWDATKTIVNLPLPMPWREEIKEVVHHLGMEYWYLGPASLALRTGYVVDEVGHIKGATFGAGVGYRKIQFDFAMEPGGDLQNYNKKFSLSAIF